MKKNLLFVYSLMFLLGSCDRDRWQFFNIHNDSEITIVVCGAYILPDTLLPGKQLKTIKIPPNRNYEINCTLFDDDYCMRLKYEKVTLFVLDNTVFQVVPWDTIRKYNIVLKRYEFNRQDITVLLKKYDNRYWALPYP